MVTNRMLEMIAGKKKREVTKMVDPVVWDIGYLVSAALFILGIKRLSSPRTAPQGNRLGAYGMLLAILVTMAKLYSDVIGLELIAGGLIIGTVIGAWLAIRVEMTGMPNWWLCSMDLGAVLRLLSGSPKSWIASTKTIFQMQALNSMPLGLPSVFPVSSAG